MLGIMSSKIAKQMSEIKSLKSQNNSYEQKFKEIQNQKISNLTARTKTPDRIFQLLKEVQTMQD